MLIMKENEREESMLMKVIFQGEYQQFYLCHCSILLSVEWSGRRLTVIIAEDGTQKSQILNSECLQISSISFR